MLSRFSPVSTEWVTINGLTSKSRTMFFCIERVRLGTTLLMTARSMAPVGTSVLLMRRSRTTKYSSVVFFWSL